MDLLKEFVDEEELSKVSGGGADRRRVAGLLAGLSLVGAVNVPVKGGGEGQLPKTSDTGGIIENSYQVSEPIETSFANEIEPKASALPTHRQERTAATKGFYSVGLTPPKKAGLAVCGIVAVGTLIEEVLRRKVFKTDKYNGVITDQEYAEMNQHFMKIATEPSKCKPNDFEKYEYEKLKKYIFAELMTWFEAMDRYYVVGVDASDNTISYMPATNRTAEFIRAWNSNLKYLVTASLASACSVLSIDKVLRDYAGVLLTRMALSPLNPEVLSNDGKTRYYWDDGQYRPEDKRTPTIASGPLSSMLGEWNLDATILGLTSVIFSDLERNSKTPGKPVPDAKWVDKFNKSAMRLTKFTDTDKYKLLLESFIKPTERE